MTDLLPRDHPARRWGSSAWCARIKATFPSQWAELSDILASSYEDRIEALERENGRLKLALGPGEGRNA